MLGGVVGSPVATDGRVVGNGCIVVEMSASVRVGPGMAAEVVQGRGARWCGVARWGLKTVAAVPAVTT